ncbi:DUF3108 domain-containing protein, partial [Psychrobacter sp. 1U2]
MSVLSINKKLAITDNQDLRHNKPKFLTALTTGASIAIIGALSMTAPTLANAKIIQPSSADYSFTVEDKYKGTANRTLKKSGNTWNYKVKARV